MKNIKVIAFDADDTLWVNEVYFREAEDKFCEMLEGFMDRHSVMKELYKTEISNLDHYGYGIKSFTLSMIETLHHVTGERVSAAMIANTLNLGREMLAKPVILLEGVKEVLEQLYGKYRLVMATKGDLLDQERKLVKSGLDKFFHHIEVMSFKEKNDYQKLLSHLDCRSEEFLMVGNSVKSDVLPVLEIGAQAIHVPYHTTWIHEEVELIPDDKKYPVVKNITEIIKLLL